MTCLSDLRYCEERSDEAIQPKRKQLRSLPPSTLANVRFRPIADISSLPQVRAMRRDKDKWLSPEWVSSKRNGETLVDDLQLLLGDLCRHWGFCDARPDDILVGDGTITADGFAAAVLIAEGWPENELPWEWREKMTKVFKARYGSSVSVAEYEQRKLR